ncbi:MAG: sulfatase-like hydrolase/transferase [Bryobacteraceae bacterium]
MKSGNLLKATLSRRGLLTGACSLAAEASLNAQQDVRPNIVVILVDDMGYGDPGCYGGEGPTANIDKLASQGVRFTQSYAASPICSPSRVGIMTGQCPARHGIYSYLDSRKRQRELGMRDFLNPEAATIPRTFQQAGYATAHFGKWHMGGGRDVDDAPLPKAYGFDESLVSFEGLGDRVLPPGKLSDMSERLGRGEISHAPKHELTEIYVNRGIDFIKRNTDRPFYLHLWPNDVHDPFAPKPELLKKYDRYSSNKYVQQYFAVLDELDRQIGRLVDAIDSAGLREKTMIVFVSDNGPTAWPRYYKEGLQPPGSTAGLRGRKWSLYEGGIRVPLFARWTGRIPEGRVNERTVMSTLDFFPSFCRLANLETPDIQFDGEDLSAALLGRTPERKTSLFWEYGRDPSYLRPGLPEDQSPNLAIRDDRWKLLMNDDGSRVELYDLAKAEREQNNLASRHVDKAKRLSEQLLSWRRSLPAAPEGA